MQLVASLAYAWVDRLPYPVWCLLVARFLLGLSTGNGDSVVRGWLARVGQEQYVGACQGMGLFLGPVLGLALSPLRWRPVPHWFIDAETSPGYLVAFLTVANFAALACLWRAFPRLATPVSSAHAPTALSVPLPLNSDTDTRVAEPVHFFPLLLSSFLFGVMGTVFATFESIAPLVTDHEFHWVAKENGIMFSCVGIGTVLANLMAAFLFPHFSEWALAMIGYVISALVRAINATSFSHTQGFLIIIRWPSPLDGAHLPLTQFLVGVSILAAAYPFTYAFLTMHTKLVHPMHSETASRWLHVSGTLSRIVGPVWAGYAFYYGYALHGHAYVMLGNVLLLLVAVVLLAACHSSLRPHRAYGLH